MYLSKPPWPDAERIPEGRVRDIFRPPPRIPKSVARSALVVGSRGAGKTMFFRYLKETCQGFATHIYLSTEFSSLMKAGHGPLALEWTEVTQRQLKGKAISLLALAICERLLRKKLSIPVDALITCLPLKLRDGISQIDAESISNTRDLVNRETLASFNTVAEANPLIYFVSSAGECNRHANGPLLLLFDRADVVPAPSLLPVFELLDQAGPYIALVATRPGIGGEPLASVSRQIVPGDHYDVLHLGLYPRSQDWTDFASQALEAQFGSQFSLLPEVIRNSIAVFARDSIKVAIDLTSRCIFESYNCTTAGFISLLEEFREGYLTTSQRTLQTYVEDFRESIRRIYKQAIKEHRTLTSGVLVTIKQRTQQFMFQERTRWDLFVDTALRSWAFCMPDGQRWIPGLRPAQVEIPPLLIWTKNDELWTSCRSPASITMSTNELTGRRKWPPPPPTVFVAYRMRFEESKRFRYDIAERMLSYPILNDAVVIDGSVPPGVKWPKTIRERISKAHIVIGDVEGMRPDVLFELGFAYGQGKPLILAFETFPNVEEIPIWLQGRQIGYYGQTQGLDGIVTSVATHLSDPEFTKPSIPPQPVPSLVVWLRVLDWNKHCLDQIRTGTGREGLKPEVYTDEKLTNELTIRRAASAGLLILSLDGTQIDGLMHYIAGAVISHPIAGRGPRGLRRRLIVLEQQPRTFAALSLQKCEDDEDIVALIDPPRVLSSAQQFFHDYRQWARQGTK